MITVDVRVYFCMHIFYSKCIALMAIFHSDYHKFTNTNGMKQGICSLAPPKLSIGDELLGFLQLPREKNETDAYRHSHHSTGSQSKLDEYYTPELKSMVEEKLYPMDVKLWRLVENEEALVSGSELAIRLSDQCKTKANQIITHG